MYIIAAEPKGRKSSALSNCNVHNTRLAEYRIPYNLGKAKVELSPTKKRKTLHSLTNNGPFSFELFSVEIEICPLSFLGLEN